MPNTWTPANAEEAHDAVRQALADERRMELLGGGTRRGFGGPVEADVALDLSAISGVVDYQPSELVLTVRPGLRLAELEPLLASSGQRLDFEPPDLGPLLGAPAGRGTIGGAVMTGLGGPRRISAGAPRDHFLGVKGVNGFGDAFAAGGRVVKNVTGFDLTKLLAGSFGTLSVITEMTLKVLPSAPDTSTLVLVGLDETTATETMARAFGTPAALSAAAHLPADVAATIPGVGSEPVTLLRLEGVTPSIRARAAHLAKSLEKVSPVGELAGEEAAALWKAIGDVTPFVGTDDVVWKISTAPTKSAAVAATIGGRRYYDWAGGLLWIALPAAPDAHATRVRQALAAAGGDGHATLVRAPDEVRCSVEVFQPQPAALAALTRRVKEQFDPRRIFNPGRMYGGG